MAVSKTTVVKEHRRPIAVSKGSSLRWREAVLAYIYILPAFIILIVFRLYPVVRAVYISFHKWGIVKDYYIGFQNYVTLFRDPAFWKSLTVTIFYVIATVPVTMAISLFIAYLLFQKIRFRSLFRTLYFLPYITSLVPAGMVWEWIFNYQSGILNHLGQWACSSAAHLLLTAGIAPQVYVWVLVSSLALFYLIMTRRKRSYSATALFSTAVGLILLAGILFLLHPEWVGAVSKALDTFFPIKWLQDPRGIFLFLGKKWGFKPPKWLWGPSLALIAVSIVSIWHFLGYDVVIYLAGLGNVPPAMYEAARIDGATEGQLFWYITLPLLSPTNFFLLIISSIGAFRAFTLFYVMTRGGPLRTTTSVAYFIFDRFWNAVRVGYACAAAFVLFAMILLMTIIQQRTIGRHVTYQ